MGDGITITATADRDGRHIAVAVNGVGVLFRDTLDLNSATRRKQFVGATMLAAFKGIPADEWPANVRDELDKRLLTLSEIPPGSAEPPEPAEAVPVDPRAEALGKMPDDVRADAEGLLDDPKMLERISTDIEVAGVVGERRLAMTLYLLGVSSQLPRPLAAIIRGPSTSGKSYVVERVADLFPPEVVLNATSLTTNALYYFPAGTLRHRWVVAGERSRMEDDDRAEATRALREMIESGRLTKAVPVKENDRLVTQVIEQEGPIAFVETTTLGSVFDEDANRCLMLSTDEREEQTRRILDATAARFAGQNTADLDRRRSVHHALQRMIPRLDVVIPFGATVATLYPTKRIDARRHFRHLLSLVKASALLHFRQRERDSSGHVVATIADYKVAELLARDPIGSASSGIGEGARKYLAVLRAQWGKLDADTKQFPQFTTSEAQKVGEGSRPTRYRRLVELSRVGAVEQTEPPKGQVPAKWSLTDLSIEDGTGVLPTVEKVIARLPGETLRQSN